MMLTPEGIKNLMEKVAESKRILEDEFSAILNLSTLYEVQEAEWVVPFLQSRGMVKEAEELKATIERIRREVGFIAKTGKGRYVVTSSEKEKKIAETYGIVRGFWGE